MANAQKTVLGLFYERWRSQTLYAAVKLGVFEVIGRAARPAEHVARELGASSTDARRYCMDDITRNAKGLGHAAMFPTAPAGLHKLVFRSV